MTIDCTVSDSEPAVNAVRELGVVVLLLVCDQLNCQSETTSRVGRFYYDPHVCL